MNVGGLTSPTKPLYGNFVLAKNDNFRHYIASIKVRISSEAWQELFHSKELRKNNVTIVLEPLVLHSVTTFVFNDL